MRASSVFTPTVLVGVAWSILRSGLESTAALHANVNWFAVHSQRRAGVTRRQSGVARSTVRSLAAMGTASLPALDAKEQFVP
jgi:hypothetical protein